MIAQPDHQEVPGPPDKAEADPFTVHPDRDLTLQGHYAGFITRLTAMVIDIVAIVLIADILGAAAQFLVSTLTGRQFHITEVPFLPWALFTLWAILYCIYPVATVGKTLGMTILGLHVVRADGSRVAGRGAVLRFVALPLSFLTLGIGFLLILVRRDHRALQDLIAGTAVVYAWDARAARVRFLASRRDRESAAAGVPPS